MVVVIIIGQLGWDGWCHCHQSSVYRGWWPLVALVYMQSPNLEGLQAVQFVIILVLSLQQLSTTHPTTSSMDPPSQSPLYSNLFHSAHRPIHISGSQSQLHLLPISSSHSSINTLTPLNPASCMSPYTLIPLSTAGSSTHDDILPSSSQHLHHRNGLSLMETRQMKREQQPQ